jgi:hypothetical protein
MVKYIIAVTNANEATAGIRAIYDVNGFKKPNRLTNCDGNPAAVATQDSSTADTDECVEEDMVVRDQFSVILKGNRAYPNGRAAYYTMYKK